MSEYVFTLSAQEDLKQIWLYTAADNPIAADEVEADVYKACWLLASNPDVGNKRPQWTNKPVRFWPVRGRYLVVYRFEKKPLPVLRILHSARNVPEIFETY